MMIAATFALLVVSSALPAAAVADGWIGRLFRGYVLATAVQSTGEQLRLQDHLRLLRCKQPWRRLARRGIN
jgi:hypothetical protein